MDPNSSAVERAFQLAKAGQCATIRDIMRKLKIEGYSVEQLVGSSSHQTTQGDDFRVILVDHDMIETPTDVVGERRIAQPPARGWRVAHTSSPLD